MALRMEDVRKDDRRVVVYTVFLDKGIHAGTVRHHIHVNRRAFLAILINIAGIHELCARDMTCGEGCLGVDIENDRPAGTRCWSARRCLSIP